MKDTNISIAQIINSAARESCNGFAGEFKNNAGLKAINLRRTRYGSPYIEVALNKNAGSGFIPQVYRGTRTRIIRVAHSCK